MYSFAIRLLIADRQLQLVKTDIAAGKTPAVEYSRVRSLGLTADIWYSRQMAAAALRALDPVSALVYAAKSRDVRHLFVDGRWLVRVSIGAEATDIATGAGGVWVATGNDNTLVHIDPRTGAVLGTLPLPKDETQPTSAPAVRRRAGRRLDDRGIRHV